MFLVGNTFSHFTVTILLFSDFYFEHTLTICHKNYQKYSLNFMKLLPLINSSQEGKLMYETPYRVMEHVSITHCQQNDLWYIIIALELEFISTPKSTKNQKPVVSSVMVCEFSRYHKEQQHDNTSQTSQGVVKKQIDKNICSTLGVKAGNLENYNLNTIVDFHTNTTGTFNKFTSSIGPK